jgi:hypothetical protein
MRNLQAIKSVWMDDVYQRKIQMHIKQLAEKLANKGEKKKDNE